MWGNLILLVDGLERRDQYELGSDQVWCGLHQPELASSFLDSDGVVFI